MESNEVQQKHNLDVKGTYLGIDASLRCTGIAILNKEYLTTFNFKPDCTGVFRLGWFDSNFNHLFNEFKELCNSSQIEYVCIEDYAYNAKYQAHQTGELGGIIRLKLFKNGIPFIEIAPQSLKKFVTGKGKGEKSGIKLHLYKKWDLMLEQEDQADATGCALAAMYHHQGSKDLTKAQQEVLKKFKDD